MRWVCIALTEMRIGGSGWTRSQKQASIITDRRTSLRILPDIFLEWPRGATQIRARHLHSRSGLLSIEMDHPSHQFYLTAGQAPSLHASLQRLASTFEHGFNITPNSTGHAVNYYSCTAVPGAGDQAGIFMCLVQAAQGSL